jgi:hypothetical protein
LLVDEVRSSIGALVLSRRAFSSLDCSSYLDVGVHALRNEHVFTHSCFRHGFTLGAYASVPISAAVSIQPEVVYSQRGARSAAYDYSDMTADSDAPPIGVYISEKSRHDYLEVPVLLKLSPSPAGDFVRPIFFAGPSIGFLLGAKEVYDTDYKEYLNSTDFGIILGGGVELGRLSLDARYNLGLATIARDYEASFGHVPGDVKNRAFTVTAGLRLF